MNGPIDIPIDRIRPAAIDVLAALGRPPGAGPDERLETILRTAAEILADLARPLGVMTEVSRRQFAEIYEGAGDNEPETPLARIHPRADHLALFAVTVGDAVSERIGALFQNDDYILGATLDATASEAAELAAAVVQERFEEMLAQRGDLAADTRLLRYSPGYCGWNVTGQRALFQHLQPERIGIALNERCLMMPLKSISGVIVAGPAEIHVFENAYPFCARCRSWSCRARIREILNDAD